MISYDVRVDWNNDGDYLDAHENVTTRALAKPGVTIMRGRDGVRALAPPYAGQLAFSLDNRSNDYSPLNTSSPIAGLVLPGRRARVQATHLSSTYTLATAIIDSIDAQPARSARQAHVRALGALSRLAGRRVTTALYQDIRTDQAIAHVLDAVGVSASQRVLATGQTILRWWWLDDEDAMQAIVELVASEGPGAVLYEDGLGRLVFEDRHYRHVETRCTTVQATWHASTEPAFRPDLRVVPGMQDIINEVTVRHVARSAKATQVVWTYAQTVTLSGSETVTIAAKMSDPVIAAITPVAGTDYTTTTGWIDSASLSATSGQTIRLTLTAGPAGATVTGLQLRAQPVTVDARIDVTNSLDMTSSIAAYGRRPYPYKVRPEIDRQTLVDFCNVICQMYGQMRPVLHVTLDSGHSTRRTQILTREISDRVRVVEPSSGVDEQCYIEHIAHDIAPTHHQTTFRCERASTVTYSRWDVDVWDTAVWGY